MKIEGTGAIVTGGTSGIGKAVVTALLKLGGKVCMVARNQERGERVQDELRTTYGVTSAYFLQCDVTDADQLKKTFEKSRDLLRRLDIVVTCAGYLGEAIWEHVFAVQLTGRVRTNLLALEMMRKDRDNHGGVVINISGASAFVPHGLSPTTSCVESGVVGFTRSIAARPDADVTQVRFNCVCPAVVDTPIADLKLARLEDWGEASVFESFREFFRTVNKSSPESVADAVLELIQDGSHNGTMMVVSTKGKEIVYPQTLTTIDFM